MKTTRFVYFCSGAAEATADRLLYKLARTVLVSDASRKILILDLALNRTSSPWNDRFAINNAGLGLSDMLADYLQYRARLNTGEDVGVYRSKPEDYFYGSTDDIEPGRLWLMPVGSMPDTQYAQVDWDAFYREQGHAFMKLLKAAIRKQGFTDVLIESDPGLSDTFYIAALELADVVACLTEDTQRVSPTAQRMLAVLRDPNAIEIYGQKRLVACSPEAAGQALGI